MVNLQFFLATRKQYLLKYLHTNSRRRSKLQGTCTYSINVFIAVITDPLKLSFIWSAEFWRDLDWIMRWVGNFPVPQGWLTNDWVGAEDFREQQASWRCEGGVDKEYRKLSLSFNLFYLVEGRIGSTPSLLPHLEIQCTVLQGICAILDALSIFLPVCLWVFSGCFYSLGRRAEPALRRISTAEQGTVYAESRSCCSFPWVYFLWFRDFTQQSVLYTSMEQWGNSG